MQNTKMTTLPPHPERVTLEGKNKVLGLWLYIAAESVLFASFFAVYVALRDKNLGGPSEQLLFELPLVFLATMILLTSSMTAVLAIHNMKLNKFKAMNTWLVITILLGLSFFAVEIYEFVHYVGMKHTFTSSAFGSAFYTLVGFHGAHVLFGLGWLISIVIRNWRRGVDLYTAPKFYLASLYWHFVDLVWVFIFTVVYLMGKVG